MPFFPGSGRLDENKNELTVIVIEFLGLRRIAGRIDFQALTNGGESLAMFVPVTTTRFTSASSGRWDSSVGWVVACAMVNDDGQLPVF